MSPRYHAKLEIGPKPGLLEPQAATLNRTALPWLEEEGIIREGDSAEVLSVGSIAEFNVEAEDIYDAVKKALAMADVPDICNPIIQQVKGVAVFEAEEA